MSETADYIAKEVQSFIDKHEDNIKNICRFILNIPEGSPESFPKSAAKSVLDDLTRTMDSVAL